MEGPVAPPPLLRPRQAVVDCLTCPLCGRLFDEATTVSECLHTFCRACIYGSLQEGEDNFCPRCNFSLGGVPFEKLRYGSTAAISAIDVFGADRQLSDVIAKLFPEEVARLRKPVPGAAAATTASGLSNVEARTELKANRLIQSAAAASSGLLPSGNNGAPRSEANSQGRQDVSAGPRNGVCNPEDAALGQAEVGPSSGPVNRSPGGLHASLDLGAPARRPPENSGSHAPESPPPQDPPSMAPPGSHAVAGFHLGFPMPGIPALRLSLDPQSILQSWTSGAPVSSSTAGAAVSSQQHHWPNSGAPAPGPVAVNPANAEPKQAITDLLVAASLSSRHPAAANASSQQPDRPFLEEERQRRPSKESAASPASEVVALTQDAAMWIMLEPGNSFNGEADLPAVSKPYLRIRDPAMPVSIVKKFLAAKLCLSSESELEISCREQHLIPSLPLEHVRNIWFAHALAPQQAAKQATPTDGVESVEQASQEVLRSLLIVLTYRRQPKQRLNLPTVSMSQQHQQRK
eukprot:SM000285S10801  [mRNA]  locus=s285:19167:21814:- [translate_table: standard]